MLRFMGSQSRTRLKSTELREGGAEKAMAPHSSTLAWNIPWMEEPGRLEWWGGKESDMTE